MPRENQSRRAQGGDVEGFEPTDVMLGEPVRVAKASFDPGYDLEESLDGLNMAELKQGFCTYGKNVGEPGGK